MYSAEQHVVPYACRGTRLPHCQDHNQDHNPLVNPYDSSRPKCMYIASRKAEAIEIGFQNRYCVICIDRGQDVWAPTRLAQVVSVLYLYNGSSRGPCRHGNGGLHGMFFDMPTVIPM